MASPEDSPDVFPVDEKHHPSESRELAEEATLPEAELRHIVKTSSVYSVLVSGLALFSDGYNAQISMSTMPVKCLLTTS
jgi:hypothetical protein